MQKNAKHAEQKNMQKNVKNADTNKKMQRHGTGVNRSRV